MTVGIYVIHNPNTEEVYAGSGDLGVRKQRHFKDLENGRQGRVNSDGQPLRHPNRKLQAAYNRDPNFKFAGVEMPDREDAYDCEQAMLDKFRGNPKFLNLSTDARAGVYEITDEVRAKMSESQKRHYQENPERRKQISEQLSQRTITEETREKLSRAQTGKMVSKETREKLREASLGQTVSQETRDALSAMRKGVPKSEEHREKIGEKTKQQWSDPEYREKMLSANSTKVIVNGVVCNSIKKAAEVAGIPYHAIRAKLAKGDDEKIAYA